MKWWRDSSVISMAVGSVLFLCVNGGPASGASTTSTSPIHIAHLCQVIPRVDRLVVTRRAPGDRFVFTFPAVVKVTNVGAAQAVATSACALSNASKSVPDCPAAFFVSYHLVFAVRGEKGMGGAAINVYPAGCQVVRGLGAVRTTAVGVGFYWVLGSAMGLRDASLHSFAGTLNTGG